MIRYAIRCAKGHDFESWFASATAYDDLAERELISCAVCGGTDVTKALMAPKVSAERDATARPLMVRPSEIEAKVAKLRAKLEAEATYVGRRFAEEARRVHASPAPEAPIWGEASATEAKALLEDGIPVAPLPFTPKKALN